MYNERIRKQIKKPLAYIVLTTGAAVFMFPIFWMTCTALKSIEEIMTVPPTFIPRELHWENFAQALSSFPFWRYVGNTLFLVVLNFIGGTLSTTMVAYAFSRLQWRGRDKWFMLMLSTMMLPGVVTMIPTFIMFKNLGWVNTYLPLIVPSFTAGAFGVFLNRQYFRTIPMEMTESAKIDGAGHWRIYLQIMLPLSKPIIATFAISNFMGTWNDYMGPLLYLSDQKLYTVTYGLRTFQVDNSSIWNLLMAGALVISIPTIIAFFFSQKYFIESITLTGIKA